MKSIAACSKLRICICVLLFCFTVVPLFSMDLNVNYGADLSAKFALSEWLSYEYKLSPWIDFRFGSGWRFSAQGSAYYRLTPKVPHCRPFFDLEMFRIITPKLPFCHGFVTFELGRIKIKDTHEMIMNESADGVAIHVNIPGIVMDVTASYIGFQSYYTSMAMLSYDDFYNASVLPKPYYGLAGRRAIFQWSTLFPEFGGTRTDLFGDLVAQIDLRKVVNENKYLTKKKEDVKELVDSIYMATGINGPFLKSARLYYDLGIVGEAISRQTSKKSETFMAGYLNTGLSWFMTRNMQLSTRLQYGSPNNDEGLSEYRPITYKNAGIFYEGGFADLAKPELSFKWKPSNQVAFTTSLSGFIRPRKKDELKGLKRREKFEKIYTYTEFSVGGTFVIANDIRIGADVMYGVNSKKKERLYDYSFQLKFNVGL